MLDAGTGVPSRRRHAKSLKCRWFCDRLRVTGFCGSLSGFHGKSHGFHGKQFGLRGKR